MQGAQWKWVTLWEAMGLTGEIAREEPGGLPDVTALAFAEREAPAAVQPVVHVPDASRPVLRQPQKPLVPLPAPSIWRSEEVARVAFYGFWMVIGAQGTFGALAMLAGSGLERVFYAPLAALPVVMLGFILVDALKVARGPLNREVPSADTSSAPGAKL